MLLFCLLSMSAAHKASSPSYSLPPLVHLYLGGYLKTSMYIYWCNSLCWDIALFPKNIITVESKGLLFQRGIAFSSLI